MNITLPHNFVPRTYQIPLCNAFNSFKRIILVAHRRSGKDYTCISMMVSKMMQRVGTYVYVFPTATQGRAIIWTGMDKEGKRFLDHIPEKLISKKNEQSMSIELVNGSVFKITGSDNWENTLIGTNPVGIIFSEYSLQREADKEGTGIQGQGSGG